MVQRSSAQSALSQLRWIVAITFFGFLALSMPYLIFPPLFLNPAYHHLLLPESSESWRILLLGVTLASYPFGQFIGSPLLGSISDIYSRKKIMGISLLLAASFHLLTAAALVYSSVVLLVGSRFAAGLMEGNIAIARAMASDLQEIDKRLSFGRINAAASIAYLLGPSLGALLVAEDNVSDLFGPSLPFFLMALLFTLLAYACRGVMGEKQSLLHSSTSLKERWNIPLRLRTHFSNPFLRRILFTSSLFTLFVDLFYEFGPVYLTIEGGLTPMELLPYNALLSLGLTFGSGWLAAPIAARVGTTEIVALSMGIFGLLMGMVGWMALGFAMALLFTSAGIAIGIATTNITVQLSDHADPLHQGEIMGLQSSIRVLGDGLICLLGALLLALSPNLLLALAMPIVIVNGYLYRRGMERFA